MEYQLTEYQLTGLVPVVIYRPPCCYSWVLLVLSKPQLYLSPSDPSLESTKPIHALHSDSVQTELVFLLF